MNKIKSIKTKISLGMMICVFIVGAIVGTTCLRQMNSDLLKQSTAQTKSVATMAAATVDGDMFDSIQIGDEDTEAYAAVKAQLRNFLQGDDIEYVYTMRKVGNELQFVVDADIDDPALIGESYESYEEIEQAFAGNVVADSEVTEDSWGRFYSGFAPIYNSSGKIVGIVGVDCSVAFIDNESDAMVRKVVIVECIGLVISLMFALFISGLLAKNVMVIDRKVEELADSKGDLTREISVHTKDEVGSIASSMNRFLKSLRNILLEIKGDGQKLMDNSNAIDKSMKESVSEIQNMSATMQQTAASMQDMNEKVRNIKEEADASGDLAKAIIDETGENVHHTV
jgi:methyl-accepting chemotaxis protein